jgi:hypothetical protein
MKMLSLYIADSSLGAKRVKGIELSRCLWHRDLQIRLSPSYCASRGQSRKLGFDPGRDEDAFSLHRGLSLGAKRVKGIEPSRPAWEAGVLPLNYTRTEINPTNEPAAGCSRYCSTRQPSS